MARSGRFRVMSAAAHGPDAPADPSATLASPSNRGRPAGEAHRRPGARDTAATPTLPPAPPSPPESSPAPPERIESSRRVYAPAVIPSEARDLPCDFQDGAGALRPSEGNGNRAYARVGERRSEIREETARRLRTLRVGSMPTDFRKRRSLMLIRKTAWFPAGGRSLPLPGKAGRRRLNARGARRFTPTFASRTM